MDKKMELAIMEYQCPGCSEDCTNLSNFSSRGWSQSCDNHHPGTSIGLSFKIFLGMPKGFNRTGVALGDENKLNLDIFESYDKLNEIWGEYDHLNIPVWKYLNDVGHTLIRGLSPRNNAPFLHVILEDCRDKIDCYEVTDELISEID